MTIDLGSTFATYRYLAKDMSATLKAQAKDPQVARETAYFQANIAKVKTADDLINNYRLFNYAMTAYGLSDMTYAKGFMRKVLDSDLSDKNSFANKLNDQRFTQFAKMFAFKTLVAATTSTQALQQTVMAKYTQQSLEDTAGQSDQGVQLALYFKRVAPTITSAYGLLGDTALWQVCKTVFGFPDAMANADITQQATMVKSRLNVADLKDPAKVDKLLQRFSVMWDVTNNTASNPVLALFDSGASQSVSSETSAGLLNLKYGG
ncbi:DUF1217 domain-containing protein [Roseixanthobacter liquoris]|uniref:DUF1217 domain-containing protein n=1 Tax=Roseixanthobacter liquoris TaxID=3119921 RepID=UPI0037284659